MRSREAGHGIQGWRMDHDETQSGLARRLGVTRQRIWYWETHGVPEGDTLLVKLALDQLDGTTTISTAITAVKAALTALEGQ